MPALLQPLTFIDSDANGQECHVTFEAGSVVTECRHGDLKWGAEIELIEGRISEYARRGNRRMNAMMLGGRPRLLDSLFFDPTVAAGAANGSEASGPEKGRRGVASSSQTPTRAARPAPAEWIDATPVRDSVPERDLQELWRANRDESERWKHDAEDDPAGTSADYTPPLLESVSPQGDQPPAETALRQPQVYGIVVIVDLMSLLCRGFYAGAPSKVNGVKSLLQTCANIIERLCPEYLVFAADGGHVERTKLYPPYKAHRPPKPELLQSQVQLAADAIRAIGWPIIRVPGWEADDVIASIATSIGPVAAGVMVASSDKDLLQLVGSNGVKVYRPWKDGQTLGPKHVIAEYGVDPSQMWDLLALDGDKTDGVPGVKGIGPKTACELLAKYRTLDGILEAARLMQIPGAAGKNLRAGAADARLSRQLVQLHTSLKIPSTWHDFNATSPSAGWIDNLRRLDLGSVINRLSEVLPISGRVRSGTSLIEVHDEQPSLTPVSAAAVRRDEGLLDAVHEPSAGSVRRDGEDSGSDLVDSGKDVLQNCPQFPAAASSGVPAAGKLEENSSRPGMGVVPGAVPTEGSVSDGVANSGSGRDEGTGNEWVSDFPVLAHLPPGSSWLDSARSVYADVWRDRVDGKHRECNWRVGTTLYAAWHQAWNGKPFRFIEETNEAEMTPQDVPAAPLSPPMRSEKTRKSRADQPSLF